jgi:hypothetical protein
MATEVFKEDNQIIAQILILTFFLKYFHCRMQGVVFSNTEGFN